MEAEGELAVGWTAEGELDVGWTAEGEPAVGWTAEGELAVGWTAEEAVGSSRTSVDCRGSNTPRLLRATGKLTVLEKFTVGDTTEAATLLAAVAGVTITLSREAPTVLASTETVVSTWGCAEMLLVGRGRRSTVWLDIMNCSDSDSSGMSWLVTVASGVGAVRGEGVPG